VDWEGSLLWSYFDSDDGLEHGSMVSLVRVTGL